MKNCKKLLCLMLSLAMMLALVSCSQPSNSEQPGSGTASPEETTGAEETAGAEEPYEVHIQLVGLFEQNRDREAVQNALNEITVPAINCTVVIDSVTIMDLPNAASLAIAGNQKQDVIVLGRTNKLDTAVANGVALPLDDLVAQYGQDAYEVVKDTTAACTIDGKLYGITGFPYAAAGTALYYNADMAAAYGIEMHDYMTYDELAEVGAVLKENGVYLTNQSSAIGLCLNFINTILTYGNDGSAGAIMNPVSSTTIENVFESEEYVSYWQAIKTWADLGYVPSNQLTDTVAAQEHYFAQEQFLMFASQTPSAPATQVYPGINTAYVNFDKPVKMSSNVSEFALGIAANSERPDKAMQFINLIYANKDVANLLQYGIEGLDYVKVSDNVITREGTDNADMNGYYTQFCEFGNPLNKYVSVPLDEGYFDELVAYEKEAPMSVAFGYTFDSSEYTAELGAIANVISQYLPVLNTGLAVDLDAQISDFQTALKNAGIDDVIAANQAQLNEYLAGK